jgi:hypothetical protein
MPQHWYDISIGSSDAHISLTLNTLKKHLGCQLYIPDNKELYQCLMKEREAVEKELGAKLEWGITKGRGGKDEGKASYAVQTYSDFEITDASKYGEYFDWLLERAAAFEKAFGRRIQICQ